jgi:hypothetical protein
MQQLLGYLAAGHMIVILVNAVTLQDQDCSGAFRGHYIALTGVDKANDTVSYLDPSFANGERMHLPGLCCGVRRRDIEMTVSVFGVQSCTR